MQLQEFLTLSVHKGCFFSAFRVEEEKIISHGQNHDMPAKIDVKIWFTNSLTISSLVMIMQLGMGAHPAFCLFQVYL